MASPARIEELEKKFSENARRYFAPLANEYRKAGDVQRAIELCRTFLPQQPGHMSGHIVYGQALFEAGERDEAQGVFEAALALDPENLIALRHLGDIARDRGDSAGAMHWYQRVLDADPRNEDIAAQIESLRNGPPLAPDADAGTESGGVATTEADVEPALADFAAELQAEATTLVIEPPVAASTNARDGESHPIAAHGDVIDERVAAVTPGVEDDEALLDTEGFGDVSAWLNEQPAQPPAAPPLEQEDADLVLERDDALGAPASSHATPSDGIERAGAYGAQDLRPSGATIEGIERSISSAFEAPAPAPAEPEPVEPEPAASEAATEDVSAFAMWPEDTDATAPAEDDTGLDWPVAEAEVPDLAGSTAAFIDDEGPAAPVASAEPEPEPEYEQEPEPAGATPAGSPFVTESMAEVLAGQGRFVEALVIYRLLAESRPSDGNLRDQIARLEGMQAAVMQPARAQRRSRGIGEAASAFFRRLARRGVGSTPRASMAMDSTPTASGQATDELASFFETPVSPEDDAAARTLATLFGGSSDDVGDETATVGATSSHGDAVPSHPPGRPARAASDQLSLDSVFAATKPVGTPTPAPSFSFEQFFAAPGGAGAAATSPAPTASGTLVPREPAADNEDDVEQFNAWLAGLKKT